jgi:hypothetical protein
MLKSSSIKICRETSNKICNRNSNIGEVKRDVNEEKKGKVIGALRAYEGKSGQDVKNSAKMRWHAENDNIPLVPRALTNSL